MHVFTVFTGKTHQPFLDEFFLPTLREVEPDLPIHVVELAQSSESGVPCSEGFSNTMLQKYNALWEFANTVPYGELILCSDCDIQFFRPFAADLEAYMEQCDIVFQTATLKPYKLNIGFTCMRWTPKTRALISTMLSILPNFVQEEVAVNTLLRICGFPIRYRLLPAEDYWAISTAEYWTFGDTRPPEITPEIIPQHMYMHHGCGYEGVDIKLQLMRDVRNAMHQNAVQA